MNANSPVDFSGRRSYTPGTRILMTCQFYGVHQNGSLASMELVFPEIRQLDHIWHMSYFRRESEANCYRGLMPDRIFGQNQRVIFLKVL